MSTCIYLLKSVDQHVMGTVFLHKRLSDMGVHSFMDGPKRVIEKHALDIDLWNGGAADGK